MAFRRDTGESTDGEVGCFKKGRGGCKIAFPWRKEGVSRILPMHVCEKKFLALGQKDLVDGSSSNDKDLASVPGVNDLGRRAKAPGSRDGRSPSENPIFAAWKRLADGIKRLSSHQDDVSQRGALEELQVFGQVPGDGTVVSDHAGGCHGRNGDHWAPGKAVVLRQR